MRPEQKSTLLLGVTRSKAKMLEYGVPEEHHITLTQDPAKLFTISIGLLGDIAAAINRDEPDPDALSALRNKLLFSARFFDSYLESQLNQTLDQYPRASGLCFLLSVRSARERVSIGEAHQSRLPRS